MGANPSKILHVLRSPRAEGTVRLTLDLLWISGSEQDVLVLDPEPRDLLEELRAAARDVRVETGLPRGLWKLPWMTVRVWAACRRSRPDIVICWSNGFGGFVLLGAALAGVRGLITHAGNPPTPTPWGRVHTRMTAAMVWMVRGRMVCCSHYVANRFRQVSPTFSSILRVVYNCAPLGPIAQKAAEARSRRTDAAPRLVMVATLEPHKDHATLLRAVPEVLRAFPDMKLWLVGDGSLRSELEAMSRSLGIESCVAFLGTRRDVPALLGQSDGFVFSTTEQEGLGTVLVEAMAAGLSVVASDVPACREALDDGRWGRLVPPRNSDLLAQALISLLRDPSPADPKAREEALQPFLPARMMAGYIAAVT